MISIPSIILASSTLFSVSQDAPKAERPQIFWQRSLEDAQAISRSQSRPLLVAINLDGESASDRIVVERYRDPQFVAWTRRFVCAIGHPTRHNTRDHDEKGRRIPCPRLGEITCGEHVALEPEIFDSYLGGERVSPRHALVATDGTKVFDLYYLFDLRDLDRALEEHAAKLNDPADSMPIAAGDWEKLAAARDAQRRDRLEREILALPAGTDVDGLLQAIAREGNAGSAEALRLVLARRDWKAGWEMEFAKTCESLRLGQALAAAVREKIDAAGSFPGAAGLQEDRGFLRFLGALDSGAPSTRLGLLARFALAQPQDRQAAREALALSLDQATFAELDRVLAEAGGPVDLESLTFPLAKEVQTIVSGVAPAAMLPSYEEAEKELEAADEALGKSPDDAATMARLGLASLQMARLRMERGVKGAEFLLEDASQWLARAAQENPADIALGIARARTAFFQGRFEEQESIGLDLARQATNEDIRVEALRWAGDAGARLFSARTNGEPVQQLRAILRGLVPLAAVCASVESAEIDWTSLASFCAVIGCSREELALLQAAAVRFPESATLRSALNGSLWRMGRIDLAPHKAAWIATRQPQSAAAAFHAGYAWMLFAEDRRRRGLSKEAHDAYRHGEVSLRRSLEIAPGDPLGATHFLGLCAMGRGFAHLLEGKRQEASAAFVEGLALAPSAGDARDGLDREAVDLLDGIFEWRETGASAVDARSLAELFEEKGLGARWLLALSDSCLREALRADGRAQGWSDAAGRDRRRDRAAIPPTEEGDRGMGASIDAARRAVNADASEENKRALAQALTVQAERLLLRDRNDEAGIILFEAAHALGEPTPELASTKEEFVKLAQVLRAKLGPARPLFRPGR